MRLRAGAVALAAALVAVGLVVTTPVASDAAPSLRVSRTAAMAGETVAVTGTTGTRLVRPVLLQRRDATSWVTIASARTRADGTFAMRFRAPWTDATDTALRVRAPRTTARSRTYPAVTAGARVVSTVGQTARLVTPGTVTAAEAFDVTGRFTPVRVGRATRIQHWDGSHWATVARGVEDAHGTTVFSVALGVAGTAALRAVADQGAGVTYEISEVTRIQVAPAPVPAEPPAPDACGEALLKPDGTPWTCTFADDFDGTALDPSAWVAQTHFATGTPSAFACYLDDPSTVAVAEGALHLTVRRVAEPVSCAFAQLSGDTDLVAGSVMTYRRFSQQHGRFEVRMRTSASRVQGLHEAFWLWPDDRFPSDEEWPAAGEIDVSETYSGYPDLTIPFLHYGQDQAEQNGVNTAYCTAVRGQWNTYTLDWSADRIAIAVNGTTCLVNTSADAAFLKPYIMALTAGIGATGNRYDGRAALPATTDVDYVRVWR